RARRFERDWLVSLFLVNTSPAQKQSQAQHWAFQARLSVRGPDGAPVFLPRYEPGAGGDSADRDEQRRLAMAYRFSPEFAVVLGVGVHAVTVEGNPMRAVSVVTTAVPQYEVAQTDAPSAERDPDLPELAGLLLDMKLLAQAEPDALRAGLMPLVSG